MKLCLALLALLGGALALEEAVSTPSAFVAALRDEQVDTIALENDITFNATAAEDGVYGTLPIYRYSNVTIVSADGKLKTLDFGQVPRLLWLEPSVVLDMQDLNVTGAASRRVGVLTAQWQINGSPIWPTIDGMPGHAVIMDNLNMTNAIDLCTPDVVQSEVNNFRKFSGRNDTIFGEGYTLMFVYFSIPMPLADITTKQTIGSALYTLVDTNITCIPDTGDMNTSSSSSDSGSSTPVGAIVGGVVGGLVLVAVIAAAILLWRRKRQAASDASLSLQKAENAEKGLTGSTIGSSGKPGMASSEHGHLSAGSGTHTTGELQNMWKTKVGVIDGLQLGDLLGRGAYGRVYRGRWKGAQVAVKIVEQRVGAQQTVDLSREPLLSMSVSHPNVLTSYKMCVARLMTAEQAGEAALQQQRHDSGSGDGSLQGHSSGRIMPSLTGSGGSVEVMGANDVLEPGLYETWLVSEYADRGSLADAIAGSRFGPAGPGRDQVSVLLCLLDVARGLEYLHASGIVHGDLKPQNVLLKTARSDRRGFVCKLGDFGLSRIIQETDTHIDTQSYGTATHAAPELLMEGKLTKAVDCYAFGLITWELVSGERLYPEMTGMQIIVQVTQNNFRPTISDSFPADLATLVRRCWDATPSARPDAATIVEELQSYYLHHLRPASKQPSPAPSLMAPAALPSA